MNSIDDKVMKLLGLPVNYKPKNKSDYIVLEVILKSCRYGDTTPMMVGVEINVETLDIRNGAELGNKTFTVTYRGDMVGGTGKELSNELIRFLNSVIEQKVYIIYTESKYSYSSSKTIQMMLFPEAFRLYVKGDLPTDRLKPYPLEFLPK